MSFDLEKFFNDVFRPAKGEVVTVIYDLPHGSIQDTDAWKDRRKMAEEWSQKISTLAQKYSITVSPTVTYSATGANNADLPEMGKQGGKDVKLSDVIDASSIILVMPQFSATAPMFGYARKSKKLRVGSMPGVARVMEESGLSANYATIAERCRMIMPVFNKATGAEVEFSTGHKCYFDLSNKVHAHKDDGILHPESAGGDNALANLPAGEVYKVPNEAADSRTAGELPFKVGSSTVVFIVKNNKIVDVKGEGEAAEKYRKDFAADDARRNIAEFAIGCNDKAKVRGMILEDEKAGFHWAYGRSDHLGGTVGVANFKTPANVVHQDFVYAKENPIFCKKLDVIFPDATRKTLIVNGDLKV